jgi:hypothetical protein
MATARKPGDKPPEYEAIMESPRDQTSSLDQRQQADAKRQQRIRTELQVLEDKYRGKPQDHDRDMLFAYEKMRRTDVMPLECPSPGAWSWYEYAQTEPNRFLELFSKREDAKTKAAGSVTNQRAEDDRRQQFAMLERVQRQLKLDVQQIIDDLMTRFPEDVLLTCRKHEPAWKAFFEKYPQT